MHILVIDIGGTHVKMLASGHRKAREFPSGKRLTPTTMVERVQELTEDWRYGVVSIGYPGLVDIDGIKEEPVNLGPGWVDFHFGKAFGLPVKILNDAALQALGSYEGGRMLFLGLGTSVGSAIVSGKVIVPLELGRLFFRDRTLMDYLGLKSRERRGQKEWNKAVHEALPVLKDAFSADYVLLGGGNARYVRPLPLGVRRGGNEKAFHGGFRLWETDVAPTHRPHSPEPESASPKEVWRQV